MLRQVAASCLGARAACLATRATAQAGRSSALRCAATRAQMHYQGDKAPTSLLSTGLVGTHRDGTGSDGEFFGVDPTPIEVEVLDGREKGMTLDENGFALVQHRLEHVDYYDNTAVLGKYYPEVERLVAQETGAKMVVAFDHNIRAKARKQSGQHLAGGNLVQEPLISYGVHNDYTARSAPARIQQLAAPPKHNDTLRPILGNKPAIDPDQVESLLKGRWMFINVWRNISQAPVERFPLGLCDAASVNLDELVVFEIRYSDRVGENYFVRHSTSHRWYYFPRMTRDEAVLLKCWDSRGRGFSDLMPGAGYDDAAAVPATFSLHSGFDDMATPQDAPDRESIEIRTVAFF